MPFSPFRFADAAEIVGTAPDLANYVHPKLGPMGFYQMAMAEEAKRILGDEPSQANPEEQD